MAREDRKIVANNFVSSAPKICYIAQMEKTIRELAAMSREQLYEEAVVMRGKIISLKKQLAFSEGCLEMAERPTETVPH